MSVLVYVALCGFTILLVAVVLAIKTAKSHCKQIEENDLFDMTEEEIYNWEKD